MSKHNILMDSKSENRRMSKCKKIRMSKCRKIMMIILLFLLLGSILFFYNNKSNRILAIDFPDNIAMFISKDEPITVSEYLIYAASVSQEVTNIYGKDIWNQTIEVNKGDYVTYEEYTRQQICEQIKLTHILSTYADSYNVSLSEEELLLLSSDAEEYHKSLAEANAGSLGVDLPLILGIYKENLVAEKVYKKIISDVKKTDDMFNDEYEEACIKYFEKIYKKLCKERAKDWIYSTHVNVSKLSKIELARSFDNEESSSDNESGADLVLDSLVGMEGTK